ncbi:MAG TPA: NAD(P)/FAD-dependent oxidoreductase [Mycobacteriales bacterium]|nr:NAD(P)/FAD-dependent oxidoreductase [Mycobacteriales bacterium]
MEHVDVVVVGAGPAGLATAERAAAGGARVVVLERGHAIGEPVRTSGGSFIKPLRRLGLPSSCWHPVHSIRVIGPTTDVAKHYRKARGCVLDVRRTYQWLAARAVDAGAEIRLKAHVEGAINDGGRIAGVAVRDSFRGRHELRSGLVVDASGHTGFLAREAGLRPGNDRSAVGMELELHAPGYDQDQAVFWLGDDVAPGGYGWAFPVGESRVRLGVGVVRPESDAEPRVLLEHLMKAFTTLLAPGTPASPIEMHSGLMPVLPPSATTLIGDGLISVGDAAGQGSTLLGEGIRYAIVAGRIAGDVIARSDGTYTRRNLDAYPREWQRRMGRDLAISYAVNTRICNFRDDDWDRVIRRLERLTPTQAARVFASDFKPRYAVGALVTDPSLVQSLVRAAWRQARRS